MLERLLGPEGALTIYGRELANIRQRATALRLENRAMLERVRALQTRPPHSPAHSVLQKETKPQ